MKQERQLDDPLALLDEAQVRGRDLEPARDFTLLQAPAQPKLPQALPHRGVRFRHPSRLPQIYKIHQRQEPAKIGISRLLDPHWPYDNPRGTGLDRVKL